VIRKKWKFCWFPRMIVAHTDNGLMKVGYAWMVRALCTYNLHHGWIVISENNPHLHKETP
jgi:hypothetical protein